jgi:hypothetical protein
MTDNLTKWGKRIAVLFLIGAAMMELLSRLGIIGLNLGGFAPFMWIAVGGFVFAQSAIQNNKQLQRGSLLVIAEVVVSLIWICYGVFMLSKMASLVLALDSIQYLMPTILALGIVAATLEAFSKVLD